ncbi:MAG: AMP-binding protein, partial [Chloroflexota bacterium]
IWGPLLKGVPLVLIPDEIVKEGFAFLDILSRYEIERIVLVPSYIRVLLDSFPDLAKRLPKLKYWTFSGEGTSKALADHFRKAMPHAVILNFYGMSEVTLDATWYDDRWGTGGNALPIGKPIDNMQVYLLDHNREPLPVGVPGEIYVSGVGLSQGYVGRDDLTAERFFPNPFVDDPNARIYRSGDLGRWLPEGQLEYLGRADHQVKVRGFRIELAEVEAAFRGHPDVLDIVVVLKEMKHDSCLAAYVIPETESAIDASALQNLGRERLPDYMVPDIFHFLEAFPLTPNGKINRLALPEPDLTLEGQTSRLEFMAPRTETERDILAIWTSLFDYQQISIRDNFFDVGGHSLLAIRLFYQIHERFGVNLSISTLFAAPTIETLASEIDGLLDRSETALAADRPEATLTQQPTWSPLVQIQAGNGDRPFFCIHGGGGNVVNFYPLAQLLGEEQTFYGLQARGVDGLLPPAGSIEEMAALYLDAIRSVAPFGPYRLGGYSGGGLVALEIAYQLKESGEEAEFVAFLDTLYPFMEPRRLTLMEHLTWAREKGFVRYVMNRIRDRYERSKYQDYSQLKGQHGEMIPFEERAEILFTAFWKAADRYAPKRYAGKVILYRGREVWQVYDHYPEDYCWRECLSDIEIEWVEGDHLTLLNEDNVAGLARDLKRRLSP